MRSFLWLSVPVRRGLVLAALVPMFATACAQATRDENGSYSGSGSGGAGAGGAPATSSSSGTGGSGTGGSGTGGSGGGCADACTGGAVVCQGNAVVTCVALASGCTAWSAPVTCPAGEVCSGGQCAKTCTDQCTQGATQCSGNSVLSCAKGASGCTDWGSPMACDAGKTCSDGQCMGSCTSQCAKDTKRCLGTGVQTCATMSNGCTDWGSPVACGAAMTCSSAQCAALVPASLLATGVGHVCALLNDGRTKCWGSNTYGQLGLGDTKARGDDWHEMGNDLPALDLGTGKTAKTISAGDYHACAILHDDSVKCWGLNNNGELGLGDTKARGDGPGEMGDNLPTVNLGTGKTAKAISAGYQHTCALLNDGSLKCWGNNDYGQLGLDKPINRGDGPSEMGNFLPAVDLGTGKTAVAISSGYHHTCVLLNDGSVKCWGNNTWGQLGLGDTNHRDSLTEMGDNLPAVDLGAGKTAKAISADDYSTCALLNDGSVKCWGENRYGRLGLGDTNARGDGPNEMGDNLPAVDLGAGKTATAIIAQSHTCALLNDGGVKCWGDNRYGQLGLGDTADRGDKPNEMGDNLPAVSLGMGKTVVAISGVTFGVCVLFDDGSIKCWGTNGSGQCGQGNKTPLGDGPDEMGDNLSPISL